jgi:hypothetical protein
MDIFKKLKALARRTPRIINAEAHTSHVERAVVVRWGNTATLKRTPVSGREKGNSE